MISFDDNVDSVTELLCYNDNNGSININVTGGTGEYTYLWQSGSIDASNFGAITQDISNLFAGEYILTVTDENGCQMPSETFIISQPDEINISLNQTESFVDLSCYNDSTGNLDIEVSGGFGQYTYLWSNGSTSDNLNNLPTGTYSVTITDENGCDMESENFEITQPSLLEISSLEIINASCSGFSDGSIDIEVAGGTENYEYVWSNGATTQDLNLINSNTYELTITDAQGCVLDTTFQVGEPDLLEITNIDITNVTCNGESDGFVDITLNGGTHPINS